MQSAVSKHSALFQLTEWHEKTKHILQQFQSIRIIFVKMTFFLQCNFVCTTHLSRFKESASPNNRLSKINLNSRHAEIYKRAGY